MSSNYILEMYKGMMQQAEEKKRDTSTLIIETPPPVVTELMKKHVREKTARAWVEKYGETEVKKALESLTIAEHFGGLHIFNYTRPMEMKLSKLTTYKQSSPKS